MMELRARFSLLDRLLGGFGLYGSLCRGIVHLSNRYPRAWMLFTIMAAGIGYAFILLFPYLLVSMARILYPSVMSAQAMPDWQTLVPQICLLFIAAVFTYTLFTLRFAPPAGKVLTEQEAPRLFGLLNQLRKPHGNPSIHRVVLDEGDDVRVIKTPRGGFMLRSTTTLVIGLPLLLTVSPPHFRVLLARRIGQLSARRNFISSWLYHLRSTWLLFRDLRCAKLLPARMIGHFFALYAPVYNTVALGICRREEINADRYAHNIINEQEIVEAISFHAASRDFLATKYWPAIRRMAARATGRPDCMPYEHMTTLVCKGLTTAQDTVMHRLLNEDDFRSDHPTLGDRLDNLGHSGPAPVKEVTSTAAQLLLENSLTAIMEEFHDQWLKRFAAENK